MSKGIIVHHWDADGICSASLLLKYLFPDYENWTPNRGIRRLDNDQIEWLRQNDHVLIVDMAIPVENILALSKSRKVEVIDHHLQKLIPGVKYINPIIFGKSPQDYPCTTWVIKQVQGLRISLLVIMGLLGDREHKAKEHPKIWKEVEEYMQETKYSFDQIFYLTSILNSLYKVGDIDSINKAPRLLLDEAPDIISNEDWLESYKKVQDEMREIETTPIKEINGIILLELDTEMNLVSSVAKKLFWESGKDVLVINRGFFDDRDQIYFRSRTVNTEKILEDSLEKGYFATGKQDVVGIVLPKKNSNCMIKNILKK